MNEASESIKKKKNKHMTLTSFLLSRNTIYPVIANLFIHDFYEFHCCIGVTSPRRSKEKKNPWKFLSSNSEIVRWLKQILG